MRKLIFIFCLLLPAFTTIVSAQVFSNRGRDFWVGYRQTSGSSNTQQFRIYLSADAVGDTVKLTMGEGTSYAWSRTYYVAANSTVVSDTIPKDTTTAAGGLFRNRAVHISSKTTDISAYAHIFEAANSGATMLLPVSALGTENYMLSSRQYYSTTSYAAMHLVAIHDSTWVQINPSKPTRNGWTHNGGTEPNGSYLVKLNKGDYFLLLGAIFSGSEGYDLTGTSVVSVSNAQGVSHPIAVFCGSTRTTIGCGTSTSGSGDLLFQQVEPYQYWGTSYATAPTSTKQGPTSLSDMTNIFRVLVKDSTTIVRRNGATLPHSALVNGKYYQYESNTPDYVIADKPILLAQFMASADMCPNTSGDGDPEMLYLSPMSQAVKSARFYRTTQDAITENFMTIVIPTSGLTTLQIDGANYSTYGTLVRASAHPNMPGFSVVTKKWVGTSGSSTVSSVAPFTGVTYGLGLIESYGYNIGAGYDSLNSTAVRFNTIHGYMFIDQNLNNSKEANEPYFKLARIITTRPGIDTFTTLTGNGIFDVYTDTGSFFTSVIPDRPYYAVQPASHRSDFNNYFNTDSVAFALQPIAGMHDLAVHAVQASTCRLGRPVNYNIVYENNGTDTTDAVVEMIKDVKLNFVSASVTPAYVSGDTIRWNISSLRPGGNGGILVNFVVQMPPVANIGDTIHSTVSIWSALADLAYDDNKSTSLSLITGSYDPNDKTESHAGAISLSSAVNGDYLQYTIRFQNTGTDTAYRVSISDTLDDKLDWNSFQVVAASHDYQATISNNRYVSFHFNSIYLPDSNHNEAGSHGFISYRIKTRNNVQAGDQVYNNASIYFDENAPVITNTETTSIVADVTPLRLLAFIAQTKENANSLEWQTADEMQVDRFEIERSLTGRAFEKIGTVKSRGNARQNNYRFDDAHAFTGNIAKLYYRLKIVDNDGSVSYSPVRMLTNRLSFTVAIRPNPVRETLVVYLRNAQRTVLTMNIYTLNGKLLLQQSFQSAEGEMVRTVNTAILQKGVYLLKMVTAEGEQRVMRFEKE